MYKIFIDTNKFLDFYRNKDENNEILEALSKCNDIILTQQVIDEFRRNRHSEINRLKNTLEEKKNNIKVQAFDISPVGILSDDIKEINSENKDLINNAKNNIDVIIEKVIKMIERPQDDMVYNIFNKIINNVHTIILNHNEVYYNKALKRNELGGIPRSGNSGIKHLTICDEYIWETLINESNYDLVFVTRDNTYIDNKLLLQEEYSKKTNRKIFFVTTISEGLEKLGEKISKTAKQKEQLEIINQEIEDHIIEVFGYDIKTLLKNIEKIDQIEKEVLEYRFGLKDGIRYTLFEVAEMFDKSREEIRQIEVKAIRKLKNIDNKDMI